MSLMLIFFKTILGKNLKIFFQQKYQHFFLWKCDSPTMEKNIFASLYNWT